MWIQMGFFSNVEFVPTKGTDTHPTSSFYLTPLNVNDSRIMKYPCVDPLEYMWLSKFGVLSKHLVPTNRL